MAASACFLQSFSLRSTVDVKGDRVRALGESFSAWEKLTGFSRNRYVEEAERLSMPGSVAVKKSYFEAYFNTNRIEGALIQKEDVHVPAYGTFDTEMQDENFNYRCNEILMSNVRSNEIVTEQLVEDPVIDLVNHYANRSENICHNQQDEAENVNRPQTDANLKVENSLPVHDSNQIAVPTGKWMPDPEISDWLVKEREVYSPPKLSLSTNTIRDKFSHSLSRKNATETIGKRTMTARPIHMSIHLPPHPSKTSETDSLCKMESAKKIGPNLRTFSKDDPVTSQASTRVSHASFYQAPENLQSESKSDLTRRTPNKSVPERVTEKAKVSSFSNRCPKPSSLPRVTPRPPTVISPFTLRTDERAAQRKKFFERIEEIRSKKAEKIQLQRRSKLKTENAHKKASQNSCSNPKLDEDRRGGLHLPNKLTTKTPIGGKQNSSAAMESQNSRKLPLNTNNTKQNSIAANESQDSRKLRIITNNPKQNFSAAKESQNSRKLPINTNDPKRVSLSEKIKQTTRKSFVSLAKKARQENASPDLQR